MIHGWAANGRIFDPLRRELPPAWRISAPDLPGHGGRAASESFDIAAAAAEIADGLHRPAYLLGWSLGSLVALHIAARYPDKVNALILCAGFARFTAAEGYPEGVSPALLRKMTVLFEQDYPKHMRQFLELQLLHNDNRRTIIDSILPDLLRDGTPQGIASALAAAEAADARAWLPEIRCPVLLIYGNKDSVTPMRMGEYLLRHLPDARLQIADKAAHAPFLSHTAEFARWVQDFIANGN